MKKRSLVMLLCSGLIVGVLGETGSYNNAAAAASNRYYEVYDLTTEYMSEPLGIETDGVRFGWKMKSNVTGAAQSAYQIRLYEENEDMTPVWDSGKVIDSKSVGIKGPDELKEGCKYIWKLSVWNEYSKQIMASSSFETAVSEDKVWKSAEYIKTVKSSSAPVFRVRNSLIGSDIQKARLYVTALGTYTAYVNGCMVGEMASDGKMTYYQLCPGYGNGDISQAYQTYDVTGLIIKDSDVAVSIIAGNGWYNGMSTTVGSPSVKALLRITYKDGSVQDIQTNTSDWKVTIDGGIVGNGIYYGEDFNAIIENELGDYTQVEYDDSTWDKPTKATYKGKLRGEPAIQGRLVSDFDKHAHDAYIYSGTVTDSSYSGGEVNIIDEYTCSDKDIFSDGISLSPGQTMIVNMGQNMSAVPEIIAEGNRGTCIKMRFAEMLNDGSSVGDGATQADGPKGTIYQKSLRTARSQAWYTMNGNGREIYQPRTSFFGYQYIEIAADDEITIYGLKSKALSSVYQKTGNIVTNNKNVNKLFSNIIYGQLSNYLTTPTDCNQRDERLSWTGDTQVFAQTAVYNFDSVAFLSDILKIYSENTFIKGYTPSVADDMNGYFNNWAVGWSDALVVVPWVLFNQTGDISILENNWVVLQYYMDYLLENERGADQAPIPDNERNFGDWLSFQGTSVEVISDYYYGYINLLMSKIAHILEYTEYEKIYQDKFEAIKEKFIETHVEFEDGNLLIKSGVGKLTYQFFYYTDKKGVWENNSQTSLLWMLKLGFYDSEEMKQAAVDCLIENIKNADPDPSSVRAKYDENTLAVGFLGSNIITPVLSEIGKSEVAYDLLLQDSNPSWLFEVKSGATTMWERWNSYSVGLGFGDSEMNSFNHYAYGSVAEWMYKYMAGISCDPHNGGFENIILQPSIDKGIKYNDEERIHHVAAEYESYYGKIKTEWEACDSSLISYHMSIPANTKATLYLPISNMKSFAGVNGVSCLGTEVHNGEATIKISLVSGSYDISVNDGDIAVVYGKDMYQDAESGNKPDNTQTIPDINYNIDKNKSFSVKNIKYKITSATKQQKKTVCVTGIKKPMRKINIPSSVTYNKIKYKVTEIQAKAFFKNKYVKRVSIGKNVVKIGKKAFSECKKLSNISIKGNNLKTIGKKAFSGIPDKKKVNAKKRIKAIINKMSKSS